MHKAHGTQDRTWRLRSVVSVSLERQVRERCCWQRCLQCAWQAATYIGVLVFGRAGMQHYTDFTGRKLVLQAGHWFYQLCGTCRMCLYIACTQCLLHNAVAHVVSGWSLGGCMVCGGCTCVVVSSLSVGGLAWV